jgi:hypothetical protein
VIDGFVGLNDVAGEEASKVLSSTRRDIPKL